MLKIYRPGSIASCRRFQGNFENFMKSLLVHSWYVQTNFHHVYTLPWHYLSVFVLWFSYDVC